MGKGLANDLQCRKVSDNVHFDRKTCGTRPFHTLNSHNLERVHHHSYLGVLLSEDLKWASHVAHVTSSANQTFGVIRRNFRTASVECKSQLYCSLVRPKLEYANSAWYPYLQKYKHRLDMAQHRAARVCYNNYLREPGVVTNMLNELEWPSLEGRRTLSDVYVSSSCLRSCGH